MIDLSRRVKVRGTLMPSSGWPVKQMWLLEKRLLAKDMEKNLTSKELNDFPEGMLLQNSVMEEQ